MSLAESAVEASLKAELERRMPQILYEQWFSLAEIMLWDGGRLELGVQNRFYKSWIEARYMPLLRDAAAAAFGTSVQVSVSVSPKLLAASRKSQARDKAEAEKLDLPSAAPSPAPAAIPAKAALGLKLNPDFTFDGFVIGSSNRLSHAVALRAVENPGEYTRIYFCGQHGVGKTHLLQAACQALRLAKPDAAIAYVTAERFVSDFTSAHAAGKVKEFRSAYRKLDVLAFDDVQALGVGSKAGTQAELMGIIDELDSRGKQVFFAATLPPADLEGVDAKLRDRMGAGFVDKLALPDAGTRRELIVRKMAERGVSLPDAAATLLARELTGNVRKLEGTVLRLAALIQIEGMEPTTNCIRMALEVSAPSARPTALAFPDIILAVAEEYGATPEALAGRGRAAGIRMARQLAVVLCRRLVGGSYAELGKAFGGRTHATLISAERNLPPDLFAGGLESRRVERILFRLGLAIKPEELAKRQNRLF